MDVRYINAFTKSVCNTFETMCGIPVTVGKPALKVGHEPRSDVSSIIGFSGDAAGSVVLHFSFDTACKMASAFAGAELTRDDPDFADAIGELANMVAGSAKSRFEGLDISISLPNVVVGSDHNVSPARNSPRIVIPCTTEPGPFHVEVGMEFTNQRATSGKTETVGAKT